MSEDDALREKTAAFKKSIGEAVKACGEGGMLDARVLLPPLGACLASIFAVMPHAVRKEALELFIETLRKDAEERGRKADTTMIRGNDSVRH